jgi:hypothetical protein
MVYHCSLLFNLLFRTAFVGLAFAFPVVSLLMFVTVLSIFAIAFNGSVGFGHGLLSSPQEIQPAPSLRLFGRWFGQ